MSRTDVHRPHWVQLKDPIVLREARPSHYHWGHSDWDPEQRRWLRSFALPCTLGEDEGQCTYWLNYNTCGCFLCVGQDGRKHARRQERTKWRSVARDIIKTPIEDLDDYVEPLIRGNAW